MNAKPDKNSEMLRAALGRLVEQSAPAPGWEARVLRESRPRRRRRLRLLWPAAAAAAVAAVAIVIGSGERKAESGTLPAPELLIAQAPQIPRPQSTQSTPSTPSTPRTPSPQSPELTVILPEPLTEPVVPVADYIDGLLAQQMELEQELLASMIDPSFDNSYTPLN